MPTRVLLTSMALGCLCGCEGSVQPPPAAPGPGVDPVPAVRPLEPGHGPNILLVTLDTLRADALGCYGRKNAETPRLDALAAKGARFARAYTVTPLTIPAHSSLFSGMLPPRHGVRDNGDFFLNEDAVTLAEVMSERGYATMASVGAEVTSHHWGFAQGFDAFHDDLGATPEEAGSRWRVERRGDAVIADAVNWFEQRKRGEEPWFAWVHLFDPHAPYDAPEPFASRHVGGAYAAEVSYADHVVGQLVDRLEAMDQLSDTWVVITGDHGEGLGSHGEQMHGVLLYDATTRIPMIIHPPGGLDRPVVVREPVSLVDLMPTVLSIAGARVPQGLDGMDLSPAVTGQAGAIPEDREIYVESLFAFRHYGWAPQRALVDVEYKLIDSTTPELYQRDDRAERFDLSESEAPRLASMRKRIRSLVVELEPANVTANRVERSSERLAQLAALGYISGVADVPVGEGELLADPVTSLPRLREVEQARLHLQEGDLDQAVTALRTLIEREPGFVDPRMMLVTALREMGEKQLALEAATDLDARQPGGSSKAIVGALQFELGDPESAVETLEAALEIDPFLAKAWEPYLQALFVTGQRGRLATAATRGLEVLPELAAIQGMSGVVLAMEGDCAAAEPLLRAALGEKPRLPFVNQHLGVCLLERGDAEQAETFLNEELSLYGALQVRYLLVEIHAEQARYEEQLEQLSAIVQAEPPSFLTHHSMAQVLFNMKRYLEAEEAVSSCRELAPQYPACAMLEANVLGKLGRHVEAKQAYQRALQLGEEAKERNAAGL